EPSRGTVVARVHLGGEPAHAGPPHTIDTLLRPLPARQQAVPLLEGRGATILGARLAGAGLVVAGGRPFTAPVGREVPVGGAPEGQRSQQEQRAEQDGSDELFFGPRKVFVGGAPRTPEGSGGSRARRKRKRSHGGGYFRGRGSSGAKHQGTRGHRPKGSKQPSC